MKPMTPKQAKEGAIMSVDKGEEIAGMWVSPEISQTGFYKLLAKQKKDGTFEWAHLLQRADGTKKLMFRGDVKTKKELQKVVDIASTQLSRIFGPSIKLKVAEADFYSLDGMKLKHEKE